MQKTFHLVLLISGSHIGVECERVCACACVRACQACEISILTSNYQHPLWICQNHRALRQQPKPVKPGITDKTQ